MVRVHCCATCHSHSFIFHADIYDIFLEQDNLVDNEDYLRHNLTRVTLEFSGRVWLARRSAQGTDKSHVYLKKIFSLLFQASMTTRVP